MIFKRKKPAGFDKPGKGKFGGSDPTPSSNEDHPDVTDKGAKVSLKQRTPKMPFKVR